MKLLNTSLLEEKKSKFYGYLYEIDTKEDINIILDDIKKKEMDILIVIMNIRIII